MKNKYQFQIECQGKDKINSISKILGIQSTNLAVSNFWIYEIDYKDHTDLIASLNSFITILNDMFIELGKLDVDKTDISLWLFYEYENQCNMEFDFNFLKLLGENQIDFCISCWQK